MKTFWYNIKYKFSQEYRIYHHKIYIDLGFHKLLKYLWKVRKQINIKSLKLKVYKGDCGYNIWCDYYMDIRASYSDFINKWFAIHVEPLGYKYKWGFYVWEYCPEIVIVFNKKIRYTIRLETTNNREFWQNVVNLIARKKD